MSKYIEQLTEKDIKEFAQFADCKYVKANIHKSCVAFTLKHKLEYIELNFVADDFTVKTRNCFGTSDIYEDEIEKLWRLFLKKKFKKEYKNDFIAWLDYQKHFIQHPTKSL